MKKILYCEDETDLAHIVKGCLEYSGFEVDYCTNGMQAIKRYRTSKPDIIILDIMMPELDGFNTAIQIRESDLSTPIIFVTARTQTADVLRGFDIGANDYIKKPYSVEELIARINSLLKSNLKTKIQEHKIGRFIFDPIHKKLQLGETIKSLSYRESELLRKLAENKNQVIKRKDILESLWEDESFFTGRSLDVFVSRLRTYLRADENIRIVNVRKSGYMLLSNE